MQVEKGGMDEAFVDVTREAELRVAHGACPASWHGHLHLGEVGTAVGSSLASVTCCACLFGWPLTHTAEGQGFIACTTR